jgi:short-subunit dehydrogenase
MSEPRRFRKGDLTGRVALVTGATGDIGGAIAVALGSCGAGLILQGRDETRLEQIAARARVIGTGVVEAHSGDLADDRQAEDLAQMLAAGHGSLEILVHAAGAYARGDIGDSPFDQLDEQYRVNLRAPYRLTQLLLPMLRRNGGDIVFINSSLARSPGRGAGAYTATHHARDGLAESLRAEVNGAGIRVLSVYLGRTAGRRQEELFAAEGRPYAPEKLMQPEDVAEMVAAALCLSRRAEVMSLTMRSAVKTY